MEASGKAVGTLVGAVAEGFGLCFGFGWGVECSEGVLAVGFGFGRHGCELGMG